MKPSIKEDVVTYELDNLLAEAWEATFNIDTEEPIPTRVRASTLTLKIKIDRPSAALYGRRA